MSNPPANYKAALEELQEILAKLQVADTPLEDLTTYAQRARELVSFCQDALRKTEVSLQDLFQDQE